MCVRTTACRPTHKTPTDSRLKDERKREREKITGNPCVTRSGKEEEEEEERKKAHVFE